MTSLSPAAQAVINSTAEQVLADRRIKIEHIAAAALRAAADGCDPNWVATTVFHHLYAIADELEGQ
jgi:predicted HD phosphohydrolase